MTQWLCLCGVIKVLFEIELENCAHLKKDWHVPLWVIKVLFEIEFENCGHLKDSQVSGGHNDCAFVEWLKCYLKLNLKIVVILKKDSQAKWRT